MMSNKKDATHHDIPNQTAGKRTTDNKKKRNFFFEKVPISIYPDPSHYENIDFEKELAKFPEKV